MRLFVAVFPPEDVRSHLRQHLTTGLRSGRGPGVRLTPVERWHLTLHFLGEVAPERQGEVERALDGVPMLEKRPRLRLAGGGRFGSGRSTALWAGVEGDVDALADVHGAVTDALGAEATTLTPHLTVAYAQSSVLRDALAEYTGPEWTADEFVLVRSRYADGGGYQSLRAWPL